MLRRVISFLMIFISTVALAHDTGRICSNPYCSMCMYLHLQAGHGTSGYMTDPFALHQQLHQESYRQFTDQPTYDTANPVVRTGATDAPHVAQELPNGTPNIVVTGILKLAKPQPHEILYDLGCGDGRVVVAAAKKYGCKAIGIEIDPKIADIARVNVKKAGVEHLVTIVTADARSISLDNADIIVMYLFPDLMKELQPEIFKAKRIFSYSHAIPNVSNRTWAVNWRGVKYPFYMWERPRSAWSMMPASN